MIVLKRGWGEIAYLWFATVLCGLLALFLIAVGFAALSNDSAVNVAFFLALCGGLMLLLALYVLEETLARGGVRIVIDDATIKLRLPSRRGHVRFAAINEALPLAAVVGIESRTETFSSSALQTTYVLALKDGRTIALGSDKQMLAPFFAQAAQAISQKLKLPIRHLGVVPADAGFLLLRGATMPPWESPVLPAAQAQKTLRRTQNFLFYSRLIVLAAMALAVIARVSN